MFLKWWKGSGKQTCGTQRCVWSWCPDKLFGHGMTTTSFMLWIFIASSLTLSMSRNPLVCDERMKWIQIGEQEGLRGNQFLVFPANQCVSIIMRTGMISLWLETLHVSSSKLTHLSQIHKSNSASLQNLSGSVGRSFATYKKKTLTLCSCVAMPHLQEHL